VSQAQQVVQRALQIVDLQAQDAQVLGDLGRVGRARQHRQADVHGGQRRLEAVRGVADEAL